MKMKSLITTLTLTIAIASQSIQAGSVIIVANGASTGPIITTSLGTDLALGTRLRVGSFANTSTLNSVIANFLNGSSDYAATTSLLNSNFTDLGTGANYGSTAQTSSLITVDSTKFLLNAQATLTINGSSQTRNVANGQITPVTYSAASGIGNNGSLYLWTAFNNEIGIYRASTWNTPASDLSNLTINLSAITAANASTTVLLGSYVDNATGNDYLALAPMPEPSTGMLMMIGAFGLVAMRRMRKV
jgi:hypothetical protein